MADFFSSKMRKYLPYQTEKIFLVREKLIAQKIAEIFVFRVFAKYIYFHRNIYFHQYMGQSIQEWIK